MPLQWSEAIGQSQIGPGGEVAFIRNILQRRKCDLNGVSSREANPAPAW